MKGIREILEITLFEKGEVHITVLSLILVAIIILFTEIIIWILHRIFKKSIYPKPNIDIGKSHTIYRLIKYFLWISAILWALQIVGIRITFLLAGSAALLVGLGLGLQEIFKDIVSGLILLFERNLKIGDIVELQDEIGRVKEIGFRTTKIETRDNIILIIPNSKFITGNVINWSHIETLTRFSVKVGVAYGSDVKMVQKVLHDCAVEHPEVSSIKDPFVRFCDFGDSSLDFEVFFWTKESFWVENIKSDIRYKIYERFADYKIQIPFPQRDIHIKST